MATTEFNPLAKKGFDRVGDPGPQGPKGDDGQDGYTPVKGVDYFDGQPGSDGREVVLQKSATHIQWKYADEETWTDLVALADLKGADGVNGIDGTDGREIELQKTATHIQWRYAGGEWSDLVALVDLKGEQGIQGLPGNDGNDGYTPIKGVDYFDGAPGADGVDGASAYEAWLAQGNQGTEQDFLNSLVGPKGDDGTNGVDGYTPIKGVDYFDGEQGIQGEPGPNQVTTSTSTNITGLLKGNGSAVAQAQAGTDYAAGNHNHDAAYAPIAKGVTNGDSHDHSDGDGEQIDHANLANIGTNTHDEIDSHIADTAIHQKILTGSDTVVVNSGNLAPFYGEKAVIFASEFASAPKVVATFNGSDAWCVIKDVTTTGFTLRGIALSPDEADRTFDWIAIGT